MSERATLTLKLTNGTTHELQIPESEDDLDGGAPPLLANLTIKQMRERVARKLNTEASTVRLVFRGKVLRDENATCGAAGIASGCVLHIVRGAGPRPDASSRPAHADAAQLGSSSTGFPSSTTAVPSPQPPPPSVSFPQTNQAATPANLNELAASFQNFEGDPEQISALSNMLHQWAQQQGRDAESFRYSSEDPLQQLTQMIESNPELMEGAEEMMRDPSVLDALGRAGGLNDLNAVTPEMLSDIMSSMASAGGGLGALGGVQGEELSRLQDLLHSAFGQVGVTNATAAASSSASMNTRAPPSSTPSPSPNPFVNLRNAHEAAVSAARSAGAPSRPASLFPPGPSPHPDEGGSLSTGRSGPTAQDLQAIVSTAQNFLSAMTSRSRGTTPGSAMGDRPVMSSIRPSPSQSQVAEGRSVAPSPDVVRPMEASSGVADVPASTSPPTATTGPEDFEWQLSVLADMGFTNRDVCLEALRRHGGRVDPALEWLLANAGAMESSGVS